MIVLVVIAGVVLAAIVIDHGMRSVARRYPPIDQTTP